MHSVQPILFPDKVSASDLHIVIGGDGQDLFAYLGTALLERVPADSSSVRYKRFLGQLVNFGWPLKELTAVFPHDNRTLRRWAAALTMDDPEAMGRAFAGRRGGQKCTPAMILFCKRRYLELRGHGRRDFRRAIQAEVMDYFAISIGSETLRLIFRQADVEAEAERQSRLLNEEAVWAADQAKGGVSPPPSGAGDGESSHHRSPIFLPPVPPVFTPQSSSSRPLGVHHLGVLLFAGIFDQLMHGRPHALTPQLQWLAQLLLGAVNIEQSRGLNAVDLARLIGPVVASRKAQRDRLGELADSDAAIEIYGANARLLNDGPGRGGDVFYYDPHSKEYVGDHKVLKGWCGRRHGVTKVMYLDAIHTRSGRPCFLEHYSPYYDLRERFFMTLARFDLLFPEGQASGRTFVVDRGIYGLDVFAAIMDREDHLLTWEKGYDRNGWDEDLHAFRFSSCRYRNHAQDKRVYQFCCQESKWSRDARVRRVIVRAANPNGNTIEVSILCTHPTMPMADLVWLIFCRWLQENDFKYLDSHFGLNQLTSRKTATYASEAETLQDKPVVSVEYKELKAELANCEAGMGRVLYRLEQIHLAEQQLRRQHDCLTARAKTILAAAKKDVENEHSTPRQISELRRQIKSAKQKLAKRTRARTAAEAQADELRRKITQLRTGLTMAVREDSKLRLLIDNNYNLLDTRIKSYFDALRITAANAFACLIRIFRPIRNDFRDDHAILRQITQAHGFVHTEDGKLQVALWLCRQLQPKERSDIDAFLQSVSAQINRQLRGRAPVVMLAVQTTTPML